ncbi:hypothetical protein NEE14_004455 [Parabacteroides sp. AD58]|uniref:Uncharacterized protein n=1 Tax=Parabacteroides absconsus TaxID=2951805 RepID=A0ABZ2ITU1_9BACT|nr:hypothetical protein [Parabacteroides sp. AD58]MCM6903365.1 hypothetical protein [Parabacteroides sp. AD58]
MSYSRSFSKRIAMHYSGTVHYPPSKDGGSVPFSGTVYEDVHVNVEVDTSAFDNSVGECNNTVGVLTGSVVATEAAQTASIRDKAMQVGDTIINGFFKTVRSEISQQIVELKNRIDATLLHLNALSKRCVEKQRQMQNDYQRLTGQYLKIFTDLNNELKNRIYELDKPAFLFKQESDKSSYHTLSSDMVSTVAVSGAESSRVEAMISASVAKKSALRTIGVVNAFLDKQRKTDNILHNSIHNEKMDAVYYIPVCYIEINGNDNRIDRKVYHPQTIGTINEKLLLESFNNMENWKDFFGDNAEQIKLSFNAELSSKYQTSDVHQVRVRDCMVRMFNNNLIKML